MRLRRVLVTGRFIEVHCAGLREDTAFSTLFGQTGGASPGAAGERLGLLRQAEGGLVYLNEVGVLGMDSQAMLLRAIEENRFYPSGGDQEVACNFQLVCGSVLPLEQLAAEGRFREDLLSRISHWSFRLPGMSERPEDFELHLQYALSRHEERTGFRARFTSLARELFLHLGQSEGASWRGNLRDLDAAVARMSTLADTKDITEEIVTE